MNVKISTQLQIGKISYVNTAPFYHGLLRESDDWKIAEGVPTQINQMIQTGQLDLAPISSLEYANRAADYLVLPDVSISARYASGSVILVSREKIENLNGKRIALSKESYSSQALVKVLLQKRFQFRNDYTDANGLPVDMMKDADACLVIGDKALFYRPKGFVYKYDLGELWSEWLGKPFCFSVWAVRKSYAEENAKEVALFHERLKENTAQNLGALEEFIKSSFRLSISDEWFAPIYSYFSQLSYDFDESIQDGLKTFYNYAKELNLIPSSADQIEFFKA